NGCFFQTGFEWFSRVFEVWSLRSRLFRGSISPFLSFFHFVFVLIFGHFDVREIFSIILRFFALFHVALNDKPVRVRDEGICLSSSRRSLKETAGKRVPTARPRCGLILIL